MFFMFICCDFLVESGFLSVSCFCKQLGFGHGVKLNIIDAGPAN